MARARTAPVQARSAWSTRPATMMSRELARVRAVFYLDITSADAEAALSIVRETLSALIPQGERQPARSQVAPASY